MMSRRRRQPARTPLTDAKRRQLTEHRKRGGSLNLDSHRPIGFAFDEQRHQLSPEQCRQANALLRILERTRPIRERGDRWQAQMALRVAGILSAVRRGAIGNSRLGHALLGHRGGRVMALHAPDHLRAISPLGCLARAVNRERTQAEQYYEEHGEPLPVGVSPTETPAEARVRSLVKQWEAAQQLAHHDRWQW
jgi:hypothetical protein